MRPKFRQSQLHKLFVKARARPMRIHFPQEIAAQSERDKSLRDIHEIGFAERLDQPVGLRPIGKNFVMLANHRINLRRPMRLPGTGEMFVR